MKVTVFNSKGKIQKTIEQSTFTLAMSDLDKVKGKSNWYARLDYADGDCDTFHYVHGEWCN